MRAMSVTLLNETNSRNELLLRDGLFLMEGFFDWHVSVLPARKLFRRFNFFADKQNIIV